MHFQVSGRCFVFVAHACIVLPVYAWLYLIPSQPGLQFLITCCKQLKTGGGGDLRNRWLGRRWGRPWKEVGEGGALEGGKEKRL